VIATGEPFETVEINQPPGGKKIYVHVCKTPIRDAARHIIGIQCIFWDITASQEAEIALRNSEERYKKLLNSVTDYIYTVELKEGKPVATRHGPGCLAVTGYAPEEYESVPNLWYLMIHPDDREPVVKQLNQVHSGKAQPLEHRIIHRDGSVRWVRNTQVPRLDEQGQVVAYDGLISDITARKLAEEKLWQANADLSASRDQLVQALKDLHRSHAELKAAQMLLIRAEKMESVGRLAAGVAHEVKNPLAILLSGIDYLRELPPASDSNVALVLKDMHEALQRADTVIRSMLDFSATQELGVQPENLNETIERPLALLRHDFSRNGIEVRKELTLSPPLIRLDRNKVEQVFLNLFMNALQAMPNGGQLTVRTFARSLAEHEVINDHGSRTAERFRPGDQLVVAEVDDTGEGIPADKMPKIFEPFFTTKPTGQGTGLGLAVSRKILEMHGADIGLKNRPEGGLRVTVTFKV
jgi:PAS domain S-box-containing protein